LVPKNHYCATFNLTVTFPVKCQLVWFVSYLHNRAEVWKNTYSGCFSRKKFPNRVWQEMTVGLKYTMQPFTLSLTAAVI